MNYKNTSHTIYECNYHIVWITKYRYKVLVWDIARRLIELIRRISEENGVEIIRWTIWEWNHVHIYVSIPPYLSVSEYVKLVKWKSSNYIQREFPEIRKRYWWKHFWWVWYFVRSSWNVTDEEIKNYIENHSERWKDSKFWEFTIS